MSKPPKELRQSVLAQFDNCSFAGKLAFEQGQNNDDSVQSHAANRGTLFHMFAEQATLYAHANHESGPIGGDVGRVMAQATITEHSHKFPIPIHEQESVRLMAWNWGEGFPVNQFPIRILEERFQLDINGFLVHGSPDMVEEIEPGVLLVTDYKTSLTIPSQQDYERKFQPAFYAMLVAHGHSHNTGEKCPTDKPITRVITREVYPRYTNSDGDLIERSQDFDHDQLADIMVAVESVVSRVETAFKSDTFPAVPGNHCAFCPKPQACPLLDNPYIETPATEQEATDLAQVWHRLDDERKKALKLLRAYADEYGGIDLNDTHELGFTVVETEAVIDKLKLKQELQHAGVPPTTHFEQRTSTRFGMKKKES